MVSAVSGTSPRSLSARGVGRIGADIGTRMLKFAQCRRSFGAWKVAAVHVQPVMSQRLADAAGVSRGVVGESLARVSLRSHGFKGTSVVAALSSEVVAPRLLELPSSEDGELADMVREELDASAANTVDLWRTKPVHRGGSDMAHVNAVILPKEQAIGCADGLQQAGLCCEAISVQCAAMARAVQLMEPGDRPVAAVDWGASAPLICICRNGQAEYSRVLRHCGLKAAVEAISAELGINEHEVAQLLVAFGVDSQRRKDRAIGARIDALLSDQLARFQQELYRTLDFIQQNQPDSVPEWLCLFGGGATIAGIAPRLTDQLRIEARTWKLEPSQLDPHLRSLEFQSLFGVAIGLSTLELDA